MAVTNAATTVAIHALLHGDAATTDEVRGADARADLALLPETAAVIPAAIAAAIDPLAATEAVDDPSPATLDALRAPAHLHQATASALPRQQLAPGDAAIGTGATSFATASWWLHK